MKSFAQKIFLRLLAHFKSCVHIGNHFVFANHHSKKTNKKIQPETESDTKMVLVINSEEELDRNSRPEEFSRGNYLK